MSIQAPPPIVEGDIDLWKVGLDRDPASIDSVFELLSADEKARANKYVFAKDRRRFIAGRAALREIVGGYLRVSSEKVKFSVRQFGKPFLSSQSGGLRFNVSHSKEVALIAVSKNREVGVDIEFVDSNFDIFSVAPRLFSEAEVSRIRSLPSNLQLSTFFSGWTRKEALLKAIGDGLSSSEELQKATSYIKEDDVSFRSYADKKVTDWSLTSFKIANDFRAALVVEGSIGKVRLWQLTSDSGLASRSEISALGEFGRQELVNLFSLTMGWSEPMPQHLRYR